MRTLKGGRLRIQDDPSDEGDAGRFEIYPTFGRCPKERVLSFLLDRTIEDPQLNNHDSNCILSAQWKELFGFRK